MASNDIIIYASLGVCVALALSFLWWKFCYPTSKVQHSQNEIDALQLDPIQSVTHSSFLGVDQDIAKRIYQFHPLR
jgi:hypothetical protein